ncbi:NAD-dependent protein deacetylase [Azotobacter chroococcum]|uniref:protein acetyllysine N-acetyltransferase n=1 Tax=Azotobacter chroococcum TaxID=353 RepID=A0AA43ZA43_9GAMM|nr:NAD-dependent protein deacetylase [Azotobacter chroococcum]NHN78863.1 NAD-dependent protein deacetylase [Azotobacter chroococcum]TBW09474.1 NAD-dependent protein deacetylase [Azotobacter chroococcum subsp. isscasi]
MLHDFDPPAALLELCELMVRQPLLVLTGAGISTPSGIPAYRDKEGVRHGRAPMTYQEFTGSAAARRRYWARSMIGWPKVYQARPNAAHQALARLAAGRRIAGLITQNVDGLHQQAGSEEVIELHGNLHRVRCLDCGKRLWRSEIQAGLEAENAYLQGVEAVLAPDGDARLAEAYLEGFRIPWCPCCGSDLLKPDVVFYGEGVPAEQTEAAALSIERAPALLVVGSTVMTYSSFRLCRSIAERGKPLAAINQGAMRAEALLNLKIERPCEQVLPWLAERLGSA